MNISKPENHNDHSMTTQERRATWGLGLVFSLRMLGMFMVLPVLATYGMTLRGANEALIGIAIGIYGLMQALCQIPFGLWSDRFGRKKLIIIGLIIFVLGSILAAVSHSIWGIIIGRALQGSGAIAAAVMALLSDLTREQNRTKAMAFIGVSFGITFAIAMILGPILTHAVGLTGLFGVIAALAFLGLLLTWLWIPDPTIHMRNRESAILSGQILQVLAHPGLLKLNFGIFCLHSLLMSTVVALPIQLVHAGLPSSRHWQVYLITMLVSFICVLPGIVYAEGKRHMRQVFIACVVFMLLAETILWLAEIRFFWLICGVQLFFIAFNLMEAILPSLVSKLAPVGNKGTAMGIYATCQFLGVAAGGSLGGWLAENASIVAVFLAGLCLCLIWLLVSFTMSEPPYLSSLRIQLPQSRFLFPAQFDALQNYLQQQTGVKAILVVPGEHAIYAKIDSKITSRATLEQATITFIQSAAID